MGVLISSTKVFQDISILSNFISCIRAICDTRNNQKVVERHLNIYRLNSFVQQRKCNRAVGWVRAIVYCFVLKGKQVNIRIH
jgi:hypothetical protein